MSFFCFSLFPTLYVPELELAKKKNLHKLESTSNAKLLFRNHCGKTREWADEEVSGGPQLSSILNPACLLNCRFHQPPSYFPTMKHRSYFPYITQGVMLPLQQLNVLTLQVSLQAHLFSHAGLSA